MSFVCGGPCATLSSRGIDSGHGAASAWRRPQSIRSAAGTQQDRPASVSHAPGNRNTRKHLNVLCAAPEGREAPLDTAAEARSKLFNQFVHDVQPAMMEQFAEQAPPYVVHGMRTTVTNMLGTLPPQFFSVTIATVGENLAQLMYSVMLTGYLYRNAQYRLELRNSIGAGAATFAAGGSGSSTDSLDRASSGASASSSGSDSDSDALGSGGAAGGLREVASMSLVMAEEEEYAPGTQKSRVSGNVLRWHNKNGLEEVCAKEYIAKLEAENAKLRAALLQSPSSGAQFAAGTQAQQAGKVLSPAAPLGRAGSSSNSASSSEFGGSGLPAALAPASTSAFSGSSPYSLAVSGQEEVPNELLNYLKTLDQGGLSELTASAGPEVTGAMDAFIQRLLGTDDQDQLRRASSECSAQELGRLLFWLMVVGYTLRSMEVRLDMDSTLGLPGRA